jgi:hypothetical protein
VTPGGTDLDANLGDADISVASEGDAMTGERA